MVTPSYEVLILAAGSSSRMGQPKQLLSWGGQSLIRRTCLLALDLGVPVRLVLGAHKSLISKEVSDLPVTLSENHQWELGMASSLQRGITDAQNGKNNLSGVLVLLVDQPFISRDHLERLIPLESLPSQLAVTAYAETFGVPAFIGSDYFDELKTYTGDQGARMLFKKHVTSLVKYLFEPAAQDLDTPKDWEHFLREQS